MNIEIKIIAQEELQLIREYIARDSEFYANKTIFEIKEKIKKLKNFPEMGKQTEVDGKKLDKLFINRIGFFIN